GLYLQTQDHIQATADANAFLMTTGLAVLGTLLVLMLKKPPRSPAPPTTSPGRPRTAAKTTATEPGQATVAANPSRP
ncbi:MAG: hypothetical protein QOD96_4204, partial [Pseudonocardiales bacterium]|nr:hypothetical protein [Pseudonocardiales bacterium]